MYTVAEPREEAPPNRAYWRLLVDGAKQAGIRGGLRRRGSSSGSPTSDLGGAASPNLTASRVLHRNLRAARVSQLPCANGPECSSLWIGVTFRSTAARCGPATRSGCRRRRSRCASIARACLAHRRRCGIRSRSSLRAAWAPSPCPRRRSASAPSAPRPGTGISWARACCSLISAPSSRSPWRSRHSARPRKTWIAQPSPRRDGRHARPRGPPQLRAVARLARHACSGGDARARGRAARASARSACGGARTVARGPARARVRPEAWRNRRARSARSRAHRQPERSGRARDLDARSPSRRRQRAPREAVEGLGSGVHRPPHRYPAAAVHAPLGPESRSRRGRRSHRLDVRSGRQPRVSTTTISSATCSVPSRRIRGARASLRRALDPGAAAKRAARAWAASVRKGTALAAGGIRAAASGMRHPSRAAGDSASTCRARHPSPHASRATLQTRDRPREAASPRVRCSTGGHRLHHHARGPHREHHDRRQQGRRRCRRRRRRRRPRRVPPPRRRHPTLPHGLLRRDVRVF